MKTRLVFLCAAVALAASGGAVAQVKPNTGLYGGVGIGKSKAKLKRADFTFDDPAIQESRDEVDTAYKFFAGYQFARYFATELSYTDFGKFAYLYDGSSVGLGQSRITYKANSWALSGVGMIPISGGFSATGRVGVALNKAERSTMTGDFTSVPRPPAASKRRFGLLLGVGGQYDFASNLAVRFELEHYGNFGEAQADTTVFPPQQQTGRAAIHMYSLNFIARF